MEPARTVHPVHKKCLDELAKLYMPGMWKFVSQHNPTLINQLHIIEDRIDNAYGKEVLLIESLRKYYLHIVKMIKYYADSVEANSCKQTQILGFSEKKLTGDRFYE